MNTLSSEPSCIERYHTLCAEIAQHSQARHHDHPVQLIAVSKTRTTEEIEPIIKAGARQFGENRVQEARQKWPALKEKYPDLRLRLIGALQTNKAKYLPGLFDAIDSVDRPELITTLAALAEKQDYRPECLLQINTGEEPQKAGFLPKQAPAMIDLAQRSGLTVCGLMCLPPVNEVASVHFAFLRQLADDHGLVECSMGMSNDYPAAIALGATMIRVGSALFGQRSA